ncbi:glycosyltransferase, partial [Patescibacteria group bacterium]|nr:glycosyltransferase [Patescibacteria group bacterium]
FRKFLPGSSPLKVDTSLFPGEMFVDRITDEVVRNFVSDLDILLAFETPYNWNAFNIARGLGVKTILFVDFEWTREVLPVKPDLFLCTSLADYEEMEEPKIFLPIPVNRELLPFRERTKARVFLHNAGSGGKGGRNSTLELLQAIPLVRSNATFLIRIKDLDQYSDSRVRKFLSKFPRQLLKEGKEFQLGNSTVRIKEGTVQSYHELYEDGDVLIHPQIYGGLSLPIQEAVSCGMPVIAVDRFPENQFLDKDLLIEPDKVEERMIYRKVKAHLISPESLAEKIDEVFNMPLEKYSKKNDALARKWDWKNMEQFYRKVFEAVKNGESLAQSAEERKYFVTP